MKILNLYAGIGGNRKLWGNKHEIMSVEYDYDILQIYKDLYPNDNTLRMDAHKYLLEYSDGYDFIWSSPPCQSHSSFRQNICVRYRGTEPVYPDMKLYQEILFLQHNFKGKWIVENVKPYYKPLIKPTAIIGRHYFWSNFDIPVKEFNVEKIRKAQIPQLQEFHGVNLSKYKLSNKRQVLRNCIDGRVGKHIINSI